MAVVRYPVAPMVKFPSILAYFIVTVFLLLVKVKSTLPVSIAFDPSVVDKVTVISGLMTRGAVSITIVECFAGLPQTTFNDCDAAISVRKGGILL